MTTPSLPEVTEKYIKIRDALDAMRKKHTLEQASLKEQMAVLEGFLRQQIMDMGVESVKTPFGTVFQTTKTSVRVIDWDATIAYIMENDATHLLNHSVNKTAVDEFIKENKQPPPGVNRDSFIEVAVRRPSASAKTKKEK